MEELSDCRIYIIYTSPIRKVIPTAAITSRLWSTMSTILSRQPYNDTGHSCIDSYIATPTIV